MTKEEALRLALEALECAIGYTSCPSWSPSMTDECAEAITAIKAALEAKDEPVAWMHVQGNHEEPSFRQLDDWEIQNGWKQYPLYTTPPQRTWVGLTDEEVTTCHSLAVLSKKHDGTDPSFTTLLHRQIEAKLKEKNT